MREYDMSNFLVLHIVLHELLDKLLAYFSIIDGAEEGIEGF